MIKLSIENVLAIHSLILDATGGMDGVRDEKILDLAVEGIYQTFGGVDIYPSIEEKGARLGYSLICNHPFYDGNKRTGLLASITFLAKNGISLEFSDDDLIVVGLNLANGTMSYKQYLDWIYAHKKDLVSDNCL